MSTSFSVMTIWSCFVPNPVALACVIFNLQIWQSLLLWSQQQTMSISELVICFWFCPNPTKLTWKCLTGLIAKDWAISLFFYRNRLQSYIHRLITKVYYTIQQIVCPHSTFTLVNYTNWQSLTVTGGTGDKQLVTFTSCRGISVGGEK